MNKKLFLGMFAAAGMLLATSCSNDELDMAQSGNEAQVTFNLGTEGAIATRAISDGLNAKKLVCAIYDANKTLLDKVVINGKQVDANGQYVNEEAFQGGLTDQVKVTLAKGQEYTMVFWAQNDSCTAYATTDLKAVKVSYKAENGTDNASNNDDTRDAFYAAETFKVEGNKEINVTLKRPFAQVNVGVYKSDWEAAVASGITIKESSVVIKNVADEIDLLTGAVKASEAMENGITYALNAIPNDPAILKADATKDGEDEEFQWLSMSYILVNDNDASVDENGLLGTDKALLEGLQFTFKPESGQPITFEEGLAGAPVRRNWRTNILGKILTGDIQFNITIDNKFNEEDYIYPDGTAEQDLKFAATFGGTVTLSESMTLTEPLNVTADMILNMNNNKLTGSVNVAEGASLTVNGGTIENTNSSTSGIVSNGNLTLNDVVITSARHALRIESGNVVINSGTYKVVPTSKMTVYTLNVGDDNKIANVTIKGGKFIGPKKTDADSGAAVGVKTGSTVTIEGGDFSGGKNSTLSVKGTLTISGGTFDQNPKDYLANGYTAVNENDTYIVGKTVANSVADFTDALNNSNAVNLTEDIDNGTNMIAVANNNVVINMENKQVKAGGNGTKTYAFGIDNANVEVNKANTLGGGFYVKQNSTLTINSGRVEANYGDSGRNVFYVIGNSKVVINGGDYHIKGTGANFFCVEDGSSVEINGGNFTSTAASQNSKQLVKRLSGYNGTIVIKGGTFAWNPEKWLADGYEAVPTGKTWTVQAK